MLFFVSCVDLTNHHLWLGAVLINRETVELASRASADIAAAGRKLKVETVALNVPVGAPPIPPGMIERLLTLEDVESLDPDYGHLNLKVSEEGGFQVLERSSIARNLTDGEP